MRLKDVFAMLEEASNTRLTATIGHASSWVGSLGWQRWMTVVLSGCEVFYRRIFCSRCVAGIATSRGYLALLRFWR
jgi:hypothetical protein